MSDFKHHRLLDVSTKHIWENFDDDGININTLAQVASHERSFFARTFSEELGITPMRYVSAVRIYKSQIMLQTNNVMSISEICCSMGVSSVSTFTSRFTLLVGMTMTKFKKVSREPEYSLIPDQPDDLLQFPPYMCWDAVKQNFYYFS